MAVVALFFLAWLLLLALFVARQATQRPRGTYPRPSSRTGPVHSQP